MTFCPPNPWPDVRYSASRTIARSSVAARFSRRPNPGDQLRRRACALPENLVRGQDKLAHSGAHRPVDMANKGNNLDVTDNASSASGAHRIREEEGYC